ncbi:MAG: glucan ABC transporter ATP-binding protein/ permease [Pseudomonadota bacterium]
MTPRDDILEADASNEAHPAEPRAAMSLPQVYLRAVLLLAQERGLAIALAAANAAIGLVQLAEPILFGAIVDALSKGGSPWGAIGLWALIGFLGILGSVVVAVSADRLAHRQRLGAMSSAFERAITLPISYHAERGTGSVIRTIVEGTSALFATWLSFLREQCTAVIAIGFMIPVAFWMEWRLAALLLVLACIYCAFNMMVIAKTSGGQSEVEQFHMAVSGRVGDTLTNVPIVQSYSRLQAEARDLKGLMENLLRAQYPVLTWWGILTVLTRAASTITMVAVFAVGTYLISVDEITVGEIVSFVGFAGLLIAKLDVLSGFITRVFMQAPTMRSFFELVDASSPIVDAPGAKPIRITEGAVHYDNVSFRYGAGTDGVFDLSFTVPAGTTTALVGPTGSGKTTTLALLQRLREPDAGTITIDGQPIRDVTLASLRQSLAVVFQDAGLFNRSIAENLRIGSPQATDEELRDAAARAQALNFIEAKPGGLSFIAGERGGALSGGERQRIAIARAVLKDAPILVLDEATSALDTGTEAAIKRGLDDLRRDRTTIIIAHRLSTVANADQILVFDDGRIVERGTFDSLVAENGLFAGLVAEGQLTAPEDDEHTQT